MLAALPMTATTMTPTKTSFSPSSARAASTDPTRNSLIRATSGVATASTTVAFAHRPRLGLRASCRIVRRRRETDALCVISEKTSDST